MRVIRVFFEANFSNFLRISLQFFLEFGLSFPHRVKFILPRSLSSLSLCVFVYVCDRGADDICNNNNNIFWRSHLSVAKRAKEPVGVVQKVWGIPKHVFFNNNKTRRRETDRARVPLRVHFCDCISPVLVRGRCWWEVREFALAGELFRGESAPGV